MVRNRARLVPLTIATALVSATVVSLSVTGTLSTFVASIVNNGNAATSGSLMMQESNANASTTCYSNTTASGPISGANEANCSSINKFGGELLAPNRPVVTTVTIKNSGSLAAGTFSLIPGATCDSSAAASPSGSATDFCSKVNLKVEQAGAASAVYNGSLAAFAGSASKPLTTLAAGDSSVFTFTVTLDPNADNSYQALKATVPMTWRFTL